MLKRRLQTADRANCADRVGRALSAREFRLWQFARHRFIYDYHAIDFDRYPIFTVLYGYFQPEKKKLPFLAYEILFYASVDVKWPMKPIRLLWLLRSKRSRAWLVTIIDLFLWLLSLSCMWQKEKRQKNGGNSIRNEKLFPRRFLK